MVAVLGSVGAGAVCSLGEAGAPLFLPTQLWAIPFAVRSPSCFLRAEHSIPRGAARGGCSGACTLELTQLSLPVLSAWFCLGSQAASAFSLPGHTDTCIWTLLPALARDAACPQVRVHAAQHGDSILKHL